jgi:hypothetical protein
MRSAALFTQPTVLTIQISLRMPTRPSGGGSRRTLPSPGRQLAQEDLVLRRIEVVAQRAGQVVRVDVLAGRDVARRDADRIAVLQDRSRPSGWRASRSCGRRGRRWRR